MGSIKGEMTGMTTEETTDVMTDATIDFRQVVEDSGEVLREEIAEAVCSSLE